MSVTKQNPNSPTCKGDDHLSFEFPTLISEPAALQNDVVFCGKVIIRQPDATSEEDPFMALRSKPSRDRRWGSFQLSGTGYIRLQRSSSSRRYASGLFGAVKFPVQMELSDMKMRQSAARLSTKLAAATESDGESAEEKGGEKSGLKLQLTRMMRRKGRQWLNALSTSSFEF